VRRFILQMLSVWQFVDFLVFLESLELLWLAGVDCVRARLYHYTDKLTIT
jgi:ABC-type enterochelin transport system permease subunit